MNLAETCSFSIQIIVIFNSFSLFLLSSICGMQKTVFLTTHLLKDIWIVSSFVLLPIKLI